MKTIAQRFCLAASFVTLAGTALAQPAFHLIGNPPGQISEVWGLSRDGSVASGQNVFSSGGIASSFRWTSQSGRDDFLANSGAQGVSADGSTIVGGIFVSTSETQPYRRLPDGTVQRLGLLSGFSKGAAGWASADGSAVAGNCYSADGTVYSPFRWTASSGMQPLAGLGGSYTFGYDITDDGKTVVGTYNAGVFSGEPNRASVWKEGVGPTFLTGPLGMNYCEARAVNANGSVVAGIAGPLGGSRWVNGVAESLGLTGDWRSARPLAMSDDGNVIVGQLFDSPTHPAYLTFVWTPTTGMMESQDYFKMMGVPFPPDFIGLKVFSVSGDGLTFGGLAGVTSAPDGGGGCIVTVPCPGAVFSMCIVSVCVFRRRRQVL